MKLIEAVARVEARRRGVPARAVGIVWSENEREPGPGEVCDVLRTEVDEGLPERWVLRPRAARGPEDLGDVFDLAGVHIGIVSKISGSLYTIAPVPLAVVVADVVAAPDQRRRAPGRAAKAKRTAAQGD